LDDTLNLSVSQVTKFTGCENRWVLDATTPYEGQAGSDATDLGNLLHTLQGAWWSGASWRLAWIEALQDYIGEDDVAYRIRGAEIEETGKGWKAPKAFLRALPIMRDWDEIHGVKPRKDPDPEWAKTSLVALELPFDLPIPGVPGARLRGFIDGVVSTPVDTKRTHDRIRLLEFKSMGRWGREKMVPFDPQLHLYLWAAKHLFPNLSGAVFEAISTYNYKTPDTKSGAREVAEKRFKRIPLDYNQEAVDLAVRNMVKVAKRSKFLLRRPGLAIRNVGSNCTYCNHQTECLHPWDA
jgi:hypothetical protein